MPIEIKYLDDGIGILFIGKGTVTGEDIINANRQIFSSEEKMLKNKYGLIDYSDIVQFEVSNPEIEIIASQDLEVSKYISSGVVAVVAKKDYVFGINRMWETIAEITGIQWETMVFKAREDAEAWINERVKEKYGIDGLSFG